MRQSQPTPPILPKLVLSEVIQVPAPSINDDERERQRLRDAAAQSVGIGLDLLEATSPTREDSSYRDRDNDDDDDASVHRPSDSMSLDFAESASHTESVTSISRSTTASFAQSHRRRAGSLSMSHARRASTPVPSIPPFPASMSSLAPFVQLAASLPKHYPAPSLLMLALSKPWKSRHIVLTSPAPPSATRASRDTSNPPVSYLHLFRAPGPEEREMERFEINENSVVFVADEEVGSRRHIVKVGGKDVGTMRKDWNLDENGLTMVLLQIVEGAESRRWIAAIKGAILGQRCVCFPLCVAHAPS
jgi:hypothetical protein